MKASITLEKVFSIINLLKANDNAAALTECGALVAGLQAEINAETAKQGGKREAQAAALRILKHAEKRGEDRLTKALTASDGGQIIADPYRLVKLPEALPIPQYAENPATGIANTLERLLKEASDNKGEEITPPSVGDLKAYITTKKAEAKAAKKRLPNVPYEIAEGVGVDALLLLDLLQILPDAMLIPSGVERWRAVRPIYLKSAHGCGLLCPLRLNNN